jgi:acetylornithine deacetylase/succinyl-diaminopimelate desuccinylase-like protein
MISKKDLQTRCQNYEQDLIDTIKELVVVPSVINVDSTEAITAKISQLASHIGFKTKVMENPESGEQIVFVGDDFDQKKGLLFTTGFSTVDLEEAANSKFDPFRAVVEGDRLYGSGAWKNKGNVALTLFVKKILTELGHGDKIKMLYSVETGSYPYTGIKHALEHGLQAEMEVVSCPVTFDIDQKAMVYTGCRGFLRYRVNVIKKEPDDLAKIWQKTAGVNNPVDVFYEFWEKIQTVLGDNQPDPSFPLNTANDHAILGINAGTGDTLPNFLRAVISFRSVFNLSNKEYLQYVTHIAEQIAREKPFDIQIEVIEQLPAVQVPDSRFSLLHKQNLEELFGWEVKLCNDFYLDAVSIFVQRGWECAYANTLTGKNQNSFDEYLDLKDLSKYLMADVVSILKYYGIEIVD